MQPFLEIVGLNLAVDWTFVDFFWGEYHQWFCSANEGGALVVPGEGSDSDAQASSLSRSKREEGRVKKDKGKYEILHNFN